MRRETANAINRTVAFLLLHNTPIARRLVFQSGGVVLIGLYLALSRPL